eukprot:Clim_evm54s210 gene=Clim_evmTU54s210
MGLFKRKSKLRNSTAAPAEPPTVPSGVVVPNKPLPQYLPETPGNGANESRSGTRASASGEMDGTSVSSQTASPLNGNSLTEPDHVVTGGLAAGSVPSNANISYTLETYSAGALEEELGTVERRGRSPSPGRRSQSSRRSREFGSSSAAIRSSSRHSRTSTGSPTRGSRSEARRRHSSACSTGSKRSSLGARLAGMLVGVGGDTEDGTRVEVTRHSTHDKISKEGGVPGFGKGRRVRDSRQHDAAAVHDGGSSGGTRGSASRDGSTDEEQRRRSIPEIGDQAIAAAIAASIAERGEDRDTTTVTATMEPQQPPLVVQSGPSAAQLERSAMALELVNSKSESLAAAGFAPSSASPATSTSTMNVAGTPMATSLASVVNEGLGPGIEEEQASRTISEEENHTSTQGGSSKRKGQRREKSSRSRSGDKHHSSNSHKRRDKSSSRSNRGHKSYTGQGDLIRDESLFVKESIKSQLDPSLKYYGSGRSKAMPYPEYVEFAVIAPRRHIYAGQPVEGFVYLRVNDKPNTVQDVVVTYRCRLDMGRSGSQVLWSSTQRSSVVFDREGLPPGGYEFPYVFEPPAHLPPSGEFLHLAALTGKQRYLDDPVVEVYIRHEIRAHIMHPRREEDGIKKRKHLRVQGAVSFRAHYELPRNLPGMGIVVDSVRQSRIRLTAQLRSMVVVKGQPIEVHVTVENEGLSKVTEIWCKLIQVVKVEKGISGTVYNLRIPVGISRCDMSCGTGKAQTAHLEILADTWASRRDAQGTYVVRQQDRTFETVSTFEMSRYEGSPWVSVGYEVETIARTSMRGKAILAQSVILCDPKPQPSPLPSYYAATTAKHFAITDSGRPSLSGGTAHLSKADEAAREGLLAKLEREREEELAEIQARDGPSHEDVNALIGRGSIPANGGGASTSGIISSLAGLYSHSQISHGSSNTSRTSAPEPDDAANLPSYHEVAAKPHMFAPMRLVALSSSMDDFQDVEALANSNGSLGDRDSLVIDLTSERPSIGSASPLSLRQAKAQGHVQSPLSRGKEPAPLGSQLGQTVDGQGRVNITRDGSHEEINSDEIVDEDQEAMMDVEDDEDDRRMHPRHPRDIDSGTASPLHGAASRS